MNRKVIRAVAFGIFALPLMLSGLQRNAWAWRPMGTGDQGSDSEMSRIPRSPVPGCMVCFTDMGTGDLRACLEEDPTSPPVKEGVVFAQGSGAAVLITRHCPPEGPIGRPQTSGM